MLVEIAASRCPPVSEVLLVPGCASTSATPRPARLARPYRSAVSCLGQVCGVRKLRKPCRVRNRSAGSPPVQARGLVAEKKSRTERHARKGAVYIAMRMRYVREPQRSHMRGHRLRVALHLRHRNEHAVTCWPYGSGRYTALFSGPRSPSWCTDPGPLVALYEAHVRPLAVARLPANGRDPTVRTRRSP